MTTKCRIAACLFASLLILSLVTIASGEQAREVIATGVADGKTSLSRDEAINPAVALTAPISIPTQ